MRKQRRLVSSLLDSELTTALEDLREIAGASAVRLYRWSGEGCCAGERNQVPGSPLVTFSTTTSGCRRLAQGHREPLVATLPRGKVSLLSCVTCPLTTGETLALQVCFADPLLEIPSDRSRLVRVFLPVLMWAQQALEREVLGARLAELESHSGADLSAALKAQEEEREWLAYEIHDRVGQTLASAFQQLQAAEALAQSSPEIRRVVVRGAMLCREAIQEARNIMSELRPTAIEDLGLAPLVEEDLHRLEEDTKCQVRSNLTYNVRPPRDIAVIVYRILTEALNNIRRHAHAHSVVVSLECLQGEVRLRVEDDGIGFDVEKALARKRVGGLMSMQRRTELVGGKLHLESHRGKGTVVNVWLPWPKRRREDHSQ